MKYLIFIFLITISSQYLTAQEIGELAEEETSKVFPKNSLGVDFMFSEGGIGIGVFYRRQLDQKFTLFGDISMSEAKDDQEFEYIDPFTYQTITYGKKNRVFLLPLNVGVHYRILEKSISDNLRPYLNFGLGPTLVVTTPYEREFFSAFGKAQANYALGGYAGFGANFGLDNHNLIGLNIRYYVIRFLNDGVESLQGKIKEELGGIFLTINIGMMY